MLGPKVMYLGCDHSECVGLDLNTLRNPFPLSSSKLLTAEAANKVHHLQSGLLRHLSVEY